MSATAIPKRQLIELIVALRAESEAYSYFNIQPQTPLRNRLLDFPKDRLLGFLSELGPKAATNLRTLTGAFPFRRPPTLYISIIERQPNTPRRLSLIANALSRQGREAELRFPDNESVPFMYLPQAGARQIQHKGLSIYEIELQYGSRMEYVESDPDADDYGQLKHLYSLESAFVWIPLEKHEHSVIACSDYPAVRRVRDFLAIKFDIRLTAPWLSKEMLEKITQGAVPRSVTYSLRTPEAMPNDVQSITISDPILPEKTLFQQVVNSDLREQVAGFYTAHPGLALGGMGVARRDGKVWTPRRLDQKETLGLSVTLIDETERELSKIKDVPFLIKHHFHAQARIGDKELSRRARDAWEWLLDRALFIQRTKPHEAQVSADHLHTLIRQQKQLSLLTAIEYDCPYCGVRWLAKCPECQELLVPSHRDHILPICPNGHPVSADSILCQECQGTIPVADFSGYVRILPDSECIQSIHDAARRMHLEYSGSWGIQGFTVKHISPLRAPAYPRLSLADFGLWKKRAKISSRRSSQFSKSETLTILNRTHEKCRRDGTPSSEAKCAVCIASPLNPKWIRQGDTCLLRLFGIPIGQKFNGVHHGHEIADLRYEDTLLDTDSKVKVAIHVKSRRPKQPPEGMGRTAHPIKGLYTQTVYSAFQARVRGEAIDVIGIAMPNTINAEVIDSLSYAVNTLGFPFVVVQEGDWGVIINEAYEQNLFDLENQEASPVSQAASIKALTLL